ncbi:hypothetical protein DKX38_020642 [Salix brachista]|uniref:Uncharacterized protein n=1 Tax=Salix brachista TaxID=2182728 RepID=A0A5N5KB18_9ROSI|nr:hypothetical protein DKX38_020642 [Salix brachista]
MYPPASSPVADIESLCRDEELFIFLDEVNNGSPLPGNVITDVNPYIYAPSNLPASWPEQSIIFVFPLYKSSSDAVPNQTYVMLIE